MLRTSSNLVLLLLFRALSAQQPAVVVPPADQPPMQQSPMPRDYRSPRVHIDGIFVTPVANAPFTATVEIVSHSKLPDGSEHIVKTENFIARSSSGRIRNERRKLVPVTFTGKPRLISAHIYDPSSRLNIYAETETHIARQTILPEPPHTPTTALAPDQQREVPGVDETPLGQQSLDGVHLDGIRKTRVIAAKDSGTGQPVTITDDYWYSPELSIYLIIRHDDPRSGEQLVAVTHIQRTEPEASLLQVPEDYKIVDETPPPHQSRAENE